MDENQIPQDVYDIRLMFRKTARQRIVSVQIRYMKKGRAKNANLPFPEDIKESDLVWGSNYEGEHHAVYHRIESFKYIDMRHFMVPTVLGQRLERLVHEAHKKFPKEKRQR